MELSKWQPIETAPIRPFSPKDWFCAHSPYVLAWNGNHVCIASYHYTQKGKGKWHSDGRLVTGLTHWMPMPEGPTMETSPVAVEDDGGCPNCGAMLGHSASCGEDV
jgi:hypothetical protein